ncbi:MAG: hypothetical protein E7494_06225 [Ruminococcus albus]|jgi:hypothetical protein|nr:hypothetical protein [Ruminococcus albus]
MAGFSIVLVLFVFIAIVVGLILLGLGTFAAGHFAGKSQKNRKLGVALRIISYFLLIPILAFGIIIFITSKLV